MVRLTTKTVEVIARATDSHSQDLSRASCPWLEKVKGANARMLFAPGLRYPRAPLPSPAAAELEQPAPGAG